MSSKATSVNVLKNVLPAPVFNGLTKYLNNSFRDTVILHNVSPSAASHIFDFLDKLKEDENERGRLPWFNEDDGLLILQCMPTAMHERAGSHLYYVVSSMSSQGYISHAEFMSTQKFSRGAKTYILEGVAIPYQNKIPDVAITTNEDADAPQIVMEVGFMETITKLEKDAVAWFLGTEATRLVILVALSEDTIDHPLSMSSVNSTDYQEKLRRFDIQCNQIINAVRRTVSNRKITSIHDIKYEEIKANVVVDAWCGGFDGQGDKSSWVQLVRRPTQEAPYNFEQCILSIRYPFSPIDPKKGEPHIYRKDMGLDAATGEDQDLGWKFDLREFADTLHRARRELATDRFRQFKRDVEKMKEQVGLEHDEAVHSFEEDADYVP